MAGLGDDLPLAIFPDLLMEIDKILAVSVFDNNSACSGIARHIEHINMAFRLRCGYQLRIWIMEILDWPKDMAVPARSIHHGLFVRK